MPHVPQPTDLCTVTDVVAWLKGDQATTITAAEQDILQRLLSEVSLGIEQYLSRPLFASAFVETRTGTDTFNLVLKNFPITSVESLTINGTPVPAIVNPYDNGYRFDADAIYLVGQKFPRFPPKCIVVSYHAGYNTIPGDIEDAAIRLTALRFKERSRIGMSTEGMAGQATSYTRYDMPADITRALNPYRRNEMI